ncbi:MAG: glycosyltransferase family 39 protein [Gemmataceae bacterium]
MKERTLAWALPVMALLAPRVLSRRRRLRRLAIPPDALEYDRLGWNLAAHGSFSLADPPGVADLTRTPVYPLFVAVCYRLVGHNPAVPVVVQAVLAAMTVALVYRACRLLSCDSAPLAATLVAFDPLSIRYATHLLSETLFTLLFTGSLTVWLAYLRSPRTVWAAAAAALTGLAILCRPIAVLWPFVLTALPMVVAMHVRSWRPLVHLVALGGIVLGIVAPWVARNWAITGRPVLATVQGINLYYHRAAPVIAAEQGISLDDARERLRERLETAVARDRLDSHQADALMETWGREIVRAAPGTYLLVHAEGVARMFAPQDDPPARIGLSSTVQFVAESAVLLFLFPAALVGLAVGLRRPEWPGVLLLGLAVVYFAALSGPEAYARFRVPLMPILAILASVGLSSPRRQGRGSVA